MKLFEIAVIYTPKKDDANAPKIIVPVTAILATDHAKANLIAARSIPETYIDFLDQLEVVVRPF